MNSRIPCTVAALLLLSAPLSAQDRPKLDPALRMLDRPAVREAIRRAPRPGRDTPREKRPLAGMLELDRGPRGEARVGAFVRLREPIDEALAELRAAGAVVGTVAGGIATARIPLDALDGLAGSTRFEALTAARPVPVRHDVSMSAIRADEVRSVQGEQWAGFAGQGILVGIYDTGIDYGHGDFRDGDGRSRIVGLWDQTVSGTPPDGYGYGHYCDPASLDAGSCPQADNNGHGTHVAGSAVGDGSAGDDDARYAGVAPAADILVVKGGDEGFGTDRIVDGVAWMLGVAAQRGQPIVVNLSLGSEFGPHDGTSEFAEMLSDTAGPGRIIVTAAGNAGANGNTIPAQPGLYSHAMASPSTGATATFTVEVPAYTPAGGACNEIVWLELWYESDDRVDVTVVRPDGSSAGAAWSDETTDSDPDGDIYIDNASEGADAGNGDYLATIQFNDCEGGGPPAAGTWEIRATATTAASGLPIHLWIPYSELGGLAFVVGGDAGFDNRYVVAAPGTGSDVLAIGAFATRSCWPSGEGNEFCYTAREVIGDLARFSSAGPTRDGRMKPEITAPGIGIISALSRDANFPPARIAPDGQHAVLEGTSMSSPHVAGAIALMLQLDANLARQDILEIFSRTASQDAFTARTYPGGTSDATAAASDWWGHGKLDVKAAIEDIGATPSTLVVEATPLSPPAVTSERGAALPLIAMAFYADGGEPVSIRRLGFRVEGDDPGAAMQLVLDADGDGEVDADEHVLAETEVALAPDDPVAVDIESGALVAPARDTMHVLAAVRLSGDVPNGARFRAEFLPSRTQTVGIASGEEDRFRQPGDVVASETAQTTLLRPGEIFALSENPVRSERLVFNFAEAPTIAAIYSIDGRRVRDLLPLVSTTGLRIEWRLRNGRGGRVAPGVYLAVFRVGDELIREKLFIVTGASRDDTEE